jgi:hypothetical protein
MAGLMTLEGTNRAAAGVLESIVAWSFQLYLPAIALIAPSGSLIAIVYKLF